MQGEKNQEFSPNEVVVYIITSWLSPNPTTMTNKVKSSISPSKFYKQLKTQKVGQNRAIQHKRNKVDQNQYSYQYLNSVES